MTAIWCLDAFLLNLVQIYSYYTPTKPVLYILRLYTGFSVIVVSIATYSFVIMTVKSVYRTRNMVKFPIWLKQLWDLMLIFNTSTLIILYFCAFTYNNSLFFDIHWLCVAITFGVGTIFTSTATCKITFFLHNTIQEIENSQIDDKLQHNYNDKFNNNHKTQDTIHFLKN